MDQKQRDLMDMYKLDISGNRGEILASLRRMVNDFHLLKDLVEQTMNGNETKAEMKESLQYALSMMAGDEVTDPYE